MRIGIDATSVFDERSGVEGHVFAAVEALATHTDDELVLFLRGATPARWEALGDRLEIHPSPVMSQAAATQLWLPRAVRRSNIDVLHCPAKPPPATVRVPILDTIHDMVPWNRPKTMGHGASLWFRTFDGLAVRRGAHVATVSEASADQIRRRLHVDDRLHVIGQAMPPWLEAAADGATLDRPLIAGEGRYVLSVCRIEPRKDLGCVLDAWELLRSAGDTADVRLLLAGKIGWRVDDIVRRARRMAGVELLGWVDEDDLPGLYAHADSFVSASHEEGFGLPVLEAMVFGAPVIASDIAPHVEVGGAATRRFPVGDRFALADALDEVLGDELLRSRLRGAGRARASAFSSRELAPRLRDALHKTAAAA